MRKIEKIEDIYPLTIVCDRYTGSYSGGKYLAFNMDAWQVSKLPIDDSDVECRDFWYSDAKNYIVGKGDTINESVVDLFNKLREKSKEA